MHEIRVRCGEIPQAWLVGTQQNNNQSGGEGKSLRHFTVTSASVGEPGGRYSSKSGPDSAAKKAASKRFGSKNAMRLTVRELGTKKEFTYDAKRVKLAKPFVRKIGGKTIKSEYEVKVKAV